MKKNDLKMRLYRETLANLQPAEAQELQGALGGRPNPTISVCISKCEC